ncbi:hypothetical protein Aple_021520 [Acrocarpospora pleiomorpha]|uniref:Uncharacterized protein n=1 Tax=Acrocarpospora pleiomorpha TaxID=90975 RepID=A0A5M3XF28_9ACTN|nr:hypothetical protein [Acrocarpospora pleiomorpha]GES19256.1 hypothetical protein Aple_021520 [Acrocarpospora pleiomorpha]
MRWPVEPDRHRLSAIFPSWIGGEAYYGLLERVVGADLVLLVVMALVVRLPPQSTAYAEQYVPGQNLTSG